MTAISPSVRSAHRTNTREELREALRGEYAWLEGDVRVELDRDRLEMRHDKIDESGDNLGLREWLRAAARSGRGVKLDIKTAQRWPELIAEVKAAHIPPSRLMFSLGDWAVPTLGKKLRAAFPEAVIAFNVRGDGPLRERQVDRFLNRADTLGGRVAFLVDEARLTQRSLDALQERAPVCVWGSDVENRRARRGELEKMGVEGIIDLQPPPSLGDRIDRSWREVKDWLGV